ncbi:transferrin-binding protein-like solute binding protein [Sphingomonas sp. R1]|uniref:transferrin-binding protein-like solute binding protein n=1 Tax=Sphingomonas sp. R1 TaxID=399176 RepID=UPI002224E590|nr:transferrin-binding protein-like solute binding protein [Sphingomonas sp. R1]UYY78957.1 transferrin-binding protein-like solute binding protein [Sphingomonas sp. R1]
MIRRIVMMGTAAAAVALAGCGGGSSSSTATPTPTSSPTPTPTPTPTYTAFPLTAAAEFNTLNATTSYTGDPATGAVTLGVTATETLTTRVKLATAPDVTTGTYVFDEAAEESRFTNTNILVTPVTTALEFSFRSTNTATGALAGNFAQLELLNNTSNKAITTATDALLGSLTTVSYANWWRGDSTTGQKRLTYSVWGYPTLTYDVPTTGTASYTTRIVGRAISVANNATTLTRVGGTATVSVNFATGLVTTTLNLTRVPDSGAETAYTTLSAQAAIPIGLNQFNGSFVSGGAATGTIAGSFYGLQGANIGVVFGASGTINGADTRIVGELVGKKQ